MAGKIKARRNKLQSKIDRMYGYRSYADDDVEVLERSGCGRGLFAVRQFLPGELVVEVTGKLLPNRDEFASTYVMELNDDWLLEPAIPAAFANHSCNPNCELIQVSKYSLGLVAVCNIEPGSEIQFDYQWEAQDWIPRCECGAPNCRGWVVAAEEVRKMEKMVRKQRKPK